MDFSKSLARNTADGDHRKRERGYHLFSRLEANHRIRVVFGGRGIDRSESDIISTLCLRIECLYWVVC